MKEGVKDYLAEQLPVVTDITDRVPSSGEHSVVQTGSQPPGIGIPCPVTQRRIRRLASGQVPVNA